MARLKAKEAKKTIKLDASVAKTKPLSLEVECVPGLTAKAKKYRECMSALKTAARAKLWKSGKLLALRSTEKADVEGEVEQARVKLDAWNACLAELEALTIELEKALVQSVS